LKPHQDNRAKSSQLALFGNNREKTTSNKDSHNDNEFEYDDAIDYLDLTRPTRPQLSKCYLKNQPQKQIASDHKVINSKATRMANLDVVSSQTTFLKSGPTVDKFVGKTKSRKSSYARRKHSSEYDDSSLDELFSPARPAAHENSKSGSRRKTLCDSVDLGSSVERLDEYSGKSHVTGAVKHASSTSQNSFTDLSKPRSTPLNNVSKSPSCDMKNVMPQALHEKEMGLDFGPEAKSLKRKTEPLNETTNSSKNLSKRSRMDINSASVDPDINEASYLQLHSSSELQTGPIEHSESQYEEDIDQLLMQEFGDIVNFSGI
jgi:ATP-dependent DNA helicase HFM1/MER3